MLAQRRSIQFTQMLEWSLNVPFTASGRVASHEKIVPNLSKARNVLGARGSVGGNAEIVARDS